MPISCKQFRKYIIKDALMDCIYNGKILWCADSEELLVATLSNESDGATYLMQEGGPACSIFQMERGTYNDIISTFLLPRWKKEIYIPDFEFNAFDRMRYDLIYATQMARMAYLRHEEPLPSRDSIEKIWEYYRRFYNSTDGKASKEQFIKKYLNYIKT